jgi:hypothetical protein
MTPQQEAIIISETANGATTRHIAPLVGLDHSNVARHQKRLRDHINRQASELLQRGLTPARRTITRLAAIGNTKAADKDMLKLSLDASKIVLNAAGILASAGTTINNMIQINNNEMPESIRALFAQITHNECDNRTLLDDVNIIDVSAEGK